MRDTKLAVINEGGEGLQLADGEVVAISSQEFEQWLKTPENRSFRFVAGNQSFTARKEFTKKGTGEYWSGYRKVSGKLHKRYIGKSQDVTLLRLKEVAIALDTPAVPKASAQPLVTQNEYVTTLSSDTSVLQAEVERLQTKICNLEVERNEALGKLIA